VAEFRGAHAAEKSLRSQQLIAFIGKRDKNNGVPPPARVQAFIETRQQQGACPVIERAVRRCRMIIVRANHNGLVRFTAHPANDIGDITALDRLFRQETTLAAGLAEPGFDLFSALAVRLGDLPGPLQQIGLTRRREMDFLRGAERAQTQHKNGERGPAHGHVILHGRAAKTQSPGAGG
jgi:hypothetical protein